MAQLTNTRVYGTLDVDNVLTAKSGINSNGGINVASLKNNTDSEDNSAKVTLNSTLIGDKDNFGSSTNKTSSVVFDTKNKKIWLENMQNNTATHDRYAEFKNCDSNLLSIILKKISGKKTERLAGPLKATTSATEATTFNVSLNVSENFKTANKYSTTVHDDRVDSVSTYNSASLPDGGTETTVTTNVNVPIVIPAEGGEILTDKTVMAQYVDIGTTQQLSNLLDTASEFKNYIIGLNTTPGKLLRAVFMSATGGTSLYPVMFYIDANKPYAVRLTHSASFTALSSLSSNQVLRIFVSNQAAVDDIKDIIG